MEIKVNPATTRPELKQFMRVPYRLHRSNGTWIPPLRRSVLQMLDPRQNPLHQEAEIQHFLAVDPGGKVVGRIAGVIQPAYIERYGARAFFGFFESTNEVPIAKALLAAVERWAIDRGMNTLAGPYSYTSSQEVGFLVDGFDTPPALLQSHNPRYYPELIESCGYRRAFEMCTHTATRADYQHRAAELIQRGQRVLSRHGLWIRSGNVKNYAVELEGLRRLYNRSFAHHPESLAISRQLFSAQAADLKFLFRPPLVSIIESNAGPVAFSVLIPNLNEILMGRNGRLTPLMLLRWPMLLKKIHSAVILMIGADPKMFGRGIGRCIVAEIVRTLISDQYHTVHTTWIHEKNWASRALLGYLGSSPNKRYAVFEKTLC